MRTKHEELKKLRKETAVTTLTGEPQLLKLIDIMLEFEVPTCKYCGKDGGRVVQGTNAEYTYYVCININCNNWWRPIE